MYCEVLSGPLIQASRRTLSLLACRFNVCSAQRVQMEFAAFPSVYMFPVFRLKLLDKLVVVCGVALIDSFPGIDQDVIYLEGVGGVCPRVLPLGASHFPSQCFVP